MLKNTNYLMRSIGIAWLILCIFFSSANAANNHAMPLQADKAFVFSAYVVSPTEIHANWKIAPEYYIYRDRIQFSFVPNAEVQVQYPKGESKNVDDTKQEIVYSGDLTIPIKIKTTASMITLTANFQGCSRAKFCYPPMQKTVTLNLADSSSYQQNVNINGNNTGSNAGQSLLTDQNRVNKLLETQHLSTLLLIFLGLGLLLALTPCVLPMIPILMGIILGQKKPLSTKKAFTLSLTYVLGSAIIYAFAGMVAAYAGNSLQALLQTPLVITLTSALFVLLSLSLFGFYDIHLPRFWHHHMNRWSNKQRTGTYVGVFLMGMISSLIVSPCVTAPLVGVLLYIGHTGNVMLGASALFTMGLGMGIPLLLIGASAGKWVPRSGRWMEAVKKIFGFLLLAMAIWLFSRVASESTVLSLWLSLVLAIAIFFCIYMPRLVGAHVLNRSLGIILGVSGIYMVLMMNGFVPKYMRGWMGVNDSSTQTLTTPFIIVRNDTELTQQLAMARAANKPVILDFYADWCESCISMDHNVFKQPDVQRILSRYTLLRVDLTANTQSDAAILKTYNVIAPPTVLFFDTKGREIDSQRIIGEVSAQEFLARLDKVWQQLASRN